MGRILDYIEKAGDGSYHCYKTQKLVLDTTNYDVLTYEDKPASSTRSSVIAESDMRRVPSVRISDSLIKNAYPIFSYFLDGSRHIYKVDDILVGRKVFPMLAGQIIVGCCERKDMDSFKPFKTIRKLVLSVPSDFDIDDEKDNFCRLFCEKLNKSISDIEFVRLSNLQIDKLLLYATDGIDKKNADKDTYKNRGTAKIQTEMTDSEQELVAELCQQNKLDDEHYLIKDGSIEYSLIKNEGKKSHVLTKENYRYVVGVSKSFNPELISDYEGKRLSRTIASLQPFERTKAYKYKSDYNGSTYAVWYLRLRKSDFRETNFSDIIKCEMVMINDEEQMDSSMIDMISANLINEAYPVCFGSDSRWANHLYPVFLTETYCKSQYHNSNIILNLF